MIGESVPQVGHSHMKLSDLYRKIYAKIDIDQGLRDTSLRITSIADLFILLQVPWTLQSDRRSGGGREEEEKRL